VIASAIALAVLVACEGSPPATAPVAAAPPVNRAPQDDPAELEPPMCMSPDPALYDHRRIGDALALCYLETDTIVACWSFDLVSATWTPRERHQRERSGLPPRQVTVQPGKATVCKSDLSDCRTVAITFPVDTDRSVEADTNADRSLIAVVTDAIRVVDTTGRIISTIRPWPTPMSGEPTVPWSFQSARFVGPALATYIADTPITFEIRLFDPKTGKTIGEIGKGMSDEFLPVEVQPNQFSFVTFEKSAILIYDVTTAKRIKRYDVEPAKDADGYGTLVLAPDRKALFLIRDAAAYRIDLATHQVTAFAAPTCRK
jgi:hypothetical protein